MGEIDSILDSVKKKLGLDPEVNTEFDADLIDYTNMALSTLTQIGVGPDGGFAIHGNTETWSDFCGDDPRLTLARAFVEIRVKLIFDSSTLPSYVITALEDQLREYEWRLNVYVDSPNTFQIG